MKFVNLAQPRSPGSGRVGENLGNEVEFGILLVVKTRPNLDCKTFRIFAYSSTREQSNKRSGTKLKKVFSASRSWEECDFKKITHRQPVIHHTMAMVAAISPRGMQPHHHLVPVSIFAQVLGKPCEVAFGQPFQLLYQLLALVHGVEAMDPKHNLNPVSYTHLTLPTKRIV